jgi:hypothetical protein
VAFIVIRFLRPFRALRQPKTTLEEEKKMNKQMTPAEIELAQQSFARLAPISVGAALAAVESGPWPPPPNIPAAIAFAGVTMK